MRIGVLILAAGRSRRFGSDKRLAALPDGRTVLEATIGAVSESGLPLLLCLGRADRALAERFRKDDFRVLVCERAEEGMGATLAEGIAAIESWDGVLIALGDMPFIRPRSYQRVANALQHTGICVPTYNGQKGHPVGFSHSYFAQLTLASGEIGGRQVIEANSGSVSYLPLDDPNITRDIDTPADIATPSG